MGRCFVNVVRTRAEDQESVKTCGKQVPTGMNREVQFSSRVVLRV